MPRPYCYISETCKVLASSFVFVLLFIFVAVFFFSAWADGSAWLPLFALRVLVNSPSQFFLDFSKRPVSRIGFTGFLWLLVETISLLQSIHVLVCCTLQHKVESKVWRWYYWTFWRQRKLLAQSEDVLKAPVGSTEENSSWSKKIFI